MVDVAIWKYILYSSTSYSCNIQINKQIAKPRPSLFLLSFFLSSSELSLEAKKGQVPSWDCFGLTAPVVVVVGLEKKERCVMLI